MHRTMGKGVQALDVAEIANGHDLVVGVPFIAHPRTVAEDCRSLMVR